MSEMDVVLSKINIIKNCLMAIERATVEIKDDAFLMSIYELNLQRAIQACIDLSNIVLAKEGLGLPNTYKQGFQLLNKFHVVENQLTEKMCAMAGFRNISVHDYSDIKPEIVKFIVKNNLIDFEKFYEIILNRAKNWK